MFVTTKYVFCRDKHDETNIILLQQKFCRDKHTVVATKDVFCRDKHMICRLLLVAAPANDNGSAVLGRSQYAARGKLSSKAFPAIVMGAAFVAHIIQCHTFTCVSDSSESINVLGLAIEGLVCSSSLSEYYREQKREMLLLEKKANHKKKEE